ncbi:MAG: DUF1295 domain-containing protein [Saprospiraceae bacterium]
MSNKVIRLSLIIFMSLITYFLLVTPFVSTLMYGLTVITASITVVWLISLLVKDSSIVDIFWGTGFVIVVWFYLFSLGEVYFTGRNLFFVSLVSLWGLRLTAHIGYRNIGKPEDYRYQEWRAEAGKHYWWVSYLRVFLLQGIILWMLSALFIPILKIEENTFSTTFIIGISLFAIGLFFEAVGDWQLMQFKKSPSNKGKIMQTGLWKYTRHPNYFGDSVVWWSFFMMALDYKTGLFFIFAPLFMTFLLTKVSGVAMLEVKQKNTKPKYADYIRRTSSLFPWLPRK